VAESAFEGWAILELFGHEQPEEDF